jgi:hypothetical protein
VPGPTHSGHYRNPAPLEDGGIVVAHASQQEGTENLGTPTAPIPNYRFRLRFMAAGQGGFLTAGAELTSGISEAVTWFTPDQAAYSGELWELSPVEVRARTVPPNLVEPALANPERLALGAAGVAEAALRQFRREQNLGLIVVRNATDRDKADKQQPHNLRVPGGVQTVGTGGTIYDIAYFQMIQGDQVRGIGGAATPDPGRRVLARFLHEPAAIANNLPNPTGPEGSAPLFADGSTAIFVPAQRALSWQITAPDGTPIVRERFRVTLQAGEIRMCEGCRGGSSGRVARSARSALRGSARRWSKAPESAVRALRPTFPVHVLRRGSSDPRRGDAADLGEHGIVLGAHRLVVVACIEVGGDDDRRAPWRPDRGDVVVLVRHARGAAGAGLVAGDPVVRQPGAKPALAGLGRHHPRAQARE